MSAEQLFGRLLIDLRESSEYAIVSMLSGGSCMIKGKLLYITLANSASHEAITKPDNLAKVKSIVSKYGYEVDFSVKEVKNNPDVVDKMKQKFHNIVINK